MIMNTYTYVNELIDRLILYYALAEKEFIKDIVRGETASLTREHNHVIQIQAERIVALKSELDRLQKERIETINAHAKEMENIHAMHMKEIKDLHEMHAQQNVQ